MSIPASPPESPLGSEPTSPPAPPEIVMSVDELNRLNTEINRQFFRDIGYPEGDTPRGLRFNGYENTRERINAFLIRHGIPQNPTFAPIIDKACHFMDLLRNYPGFLTIDQGLKIRETGDGRHKMFFVCRIWKEPCGIPLVDNRRRLETTVITKSSIESPVVARRITSLGFGPYCEYPDACDNLWQLRVGMSWWT